MCISFFSLFCYRLSLVFHQALLWSLPLQWPEGDVDEDEARCSVRERFLSVAFWCIVAAVCIGITFGFAYKW